MKKERNNHLWGYELKRTQKYIFIDGKAWYQHMKIEFEQHDIEAFAARVAETLKPMLYPVKHGDEDILMTVEDLAKYMCCSKDFIYKLTQAKEIPHIKMGGKFILFRKSKIDKWLDSHAMPAINKSVSMLKKVGLST